MSENKQSLWNGKFILLLCLTFCSGAAAQMSYPLVAKYAKFLGASISEAGTVAGLMSLAALFVCPFAGVLSDWFNRKRILQISSFFYGIALIAHGFAGGIGVLKILRLVTGIFFSINNVTVVAFSTAFIPKERTGEGLGYTALAMILSQAIGPALGLKIVEWSGYSTTYYIAGIMAWLCGIVITILPYTEVKKTEKKKLELSNLFAFQFFGWMLLATLFSSGTGLVSTFLAIIAEERSIANVALFFTVYSCFMVFIRPSIGKLLDKKGVYVIMVPAIICASIAMVLLGISYSLTLVLVASGFHALGQGSGVPTLQADVIKKLDRSRAGVATSTIQIGQNIGNAVAPMLGGYMVQAVGYKFTFVGYGFILCLAGLLILFIHYQRERKGL